MIVNSSVNSLWILSVGYFIYHEKFVFLYSKNKNKMAKKQEVIASGKSKLQEALGALNKKYGEGTVLQFGDKTHGDYDLISTGSIGFDYITLGVGGVVRGKMYELVGWEGSGKSTICGHIVANCQKKGGKVLYIDGEHAVDKNYFESLGVDTEAMLIAQPSNGEEGFNIAIDLIQTDEIALVIIDSDSSLIPKKVLDGEVGDSAIGRKAKLNSDVYPKLKSYLSKHNVCVIVVSQYREKIGVMFGDPRTTQGGHALKFYADVRIEVSRTLAKEGTETYANDTKVKAIKNKMSPPFKLAEFQILYGKGIDAFKELMALGNDCDVLRKYGKTITYKDVKYDFEEFKVLLDDNEEFAQAIKQDIIDCLLGKEHPIEEEVEDDIVKEEPTIINTKEDDSEF